MQALWLDQADAQAVAEGEEVTLMDWGNAIIRVRTGDDKSSLTPMVSDFRLLFPDKRRSLL